MFSCCFNGSRFNGGIVHNEFLQCSAIDLTSLLLFKSLRVGIRTESWMGLLQENSIENSVQDCLLYILRLVVYTTTVINLF